MYNVLIYNNIYKYYKIDVKPKKKKKDDKKKGPFVDMDMSAFSSLDIGLGQKAQDRGKIKGPYDYVIVELDYDRYNILMTDDAWSSPEQYGDGPTAVAIGFKLDKTIKVILADIPHDDIMMQHFII